MEQIKEAFYKVKQDIDSLKKEISTLNKDLIETRESLVEMCEILKQISKKKEEEKVIIKETIEKKENALETDFKLIPAQILIQLPFQIPPPVPTQTPFFQTHPPIIPAHPTDNDLQNPLKAQNMDISTGNQGVPTDRQTNQQTDQHIDKGSYNKEDILNANVSENSIKNAAKILDSLDSLKKEIRLKFKRLTEQEFIVFSTIYQISEEKGYTDYKNLSETLNLTESSIRDYIGRLIKKGIPVDKIKINNKTIHLSISQDLKKIATLPTLLQLRAI
jgi:hypothetical protein